MLAPLLDAAERWRAVPRVQSRVLWAIANATANARERANMQARASLADDAPAVLRIAATAAAALRHHPADVDVCLRALNAALMSLCGLPGAMAAGRLACCEAGLPELAAGALARHSARRGDLLQLQLTACGLLSDCASVRPEPLPNGLPAALLALLRGGGGADANVIQRAAGPLPEGLLGSVATLVQRHMACAANLPALAEVAAALEDAMEAGDGSESEEGD
jgi:hypothetical protein